MANALLGDPRGPTKISEATSGIANARRIGPFMYRNKCEHSVFVGLCTEGQRPKIVGLI